MKNENNHIICCPVFKKCGGCQLWNLSYEEQLKLKQGKVINLLGKFGRVSPIIGMENPYHYRCKVQTAFTRGRKGVVSGVFQSSSGRIVPVDNCMTEDEACDAVIITVRKLIESFKLKVWDVNSGTGFMRHILVRRGLYTNQIMVVLVTSQAEFPSRRSFVNALVSRHPEITTIVQNVNKNSVNLTLGKENIILFGKGFIEDNLLNCTFRISPGSFYQINPAMTQTVYGKAMEYLTLTGREMVLDAYCGTGTLGIIASKNALSVTGVESVADAVRDAKWNAERNGADNITFYRGDASLFIEDASNEGKSFDSVIMDPPRAGSDIRFMRAVSKMSPEKIVYVSCNPETLARDLTYFTRHSYAVYRIQPIDVFPFTNHIETVCLMERHQ